MSTTTTVLGDSASILTTTVAKVEECTACDYCRLTEDCIPAYIDYVCARYGGQWVCGLCVKVVEEEIRLELVGADEAILCRNFYLFGTREHLIAVVHQLLRQGFDSPRGPRFAPSNPRRKNVPNVV